MFESLFYLPMLLQEEEEGLELSASAAAVDVNGKRRLMSRAVAVSAPLQEEGGEGHGMQLEGGHDQQQHGGGATGQYGAPFEVRDVKSDMSDDQVQVSHGCLFYQSLHMYASSLGLRFTRRSNKVA